MRPILVLAATLPFALPLPAQQDPAAPTTPPSAEQRMEAINQQQEQLVSAWREQVKAAQAAAADAKANGKPIPAMPMQPDFAPIVAAAQAAAKDFAGTDDAVQFLLMVVQMGADKAVRQDALQTLVDHHADSAQLAEMGRMLPYLSQIVDAEFAAKALPAFARSTNADVRGWAVLAQNKDTIDTADRAGAAYAAARKSLMAMADEVGDQQLAAEIRSTIETREKYGVGNTVADIEGQDLDGTDFKLSDYRGKVIFLDFWGDW